MGLSVFPPIASKQIPHLGPLGDGGAAGGGGRWSIAGAVAAVVLITLFCGEYRGLFLGLGTGGRLLEIISISGDPVRSITSLSSLFLSGREEAGMGLDPEPLAKAFAPRSSSKSSWLPKITISSS